jgi:hypothetical protein
MKENTKWLVSVQTLYGKGTVVYDYAQALQCKGFQLFDQADLNQGSIA